METHKAIPGVPAQVFEIGLQYYVSARAAWDHGHYQIAGNLFHHGFEMMLKGVLAHRSRYTPAQLKGRSHDLPWFWGETTKGIPYDWSRFDVFIDDLHRWELVRFGDFPEGKPKSLRIDVLRVARAGPGKPGHDEYRLCLEDADELFTLLCREMAWPNHIVRARIARGLDDYERQNVHML